MGLKEELKLNKPFASREHEALLNLYFTGTRIRKWGTDFLQPHGLTDVQFNLLMLLKYQGQQEDLSQARLSEMMLVNRANITGLVDRMEKAGLVHRLGDPADRRAHRIVLTPKGKQTVDRVEPLYAQEIKRLTGSLRRQEIEQLIRLCEKVRNNLEI
ncbi:MAG TPA: MarR family transcriptional regulator [Anaerohalosphaeraceae bacterium]|jgi:DNA-binding MarR family transcriptional regulator|nr:MarR family transcriptional regulator [Anaerohalosphaeraceae bacterium]HPB92652.1 MarR family transcriptional regulator [Anaerohalosphaeraceae bacterium]HRT23065.1 MarR family transcriptional regulator [Anaerohalosphaeraceae bacterium]HRU14751.1 MarR family transcriptional regulator [Anaerohalosphaeraceae bacterium]